MSEATKQALEEALHAHISDEKEGALTGAYVMIAETFHVDGDQDADTMYVVTEGSIYTQIGLVYAFRDTISTRFPEGDDA